MDSIGYCKRCDVVAPIEIKYGRGTYQIDDNTPIQTTLRGDYCSSCGKLIMHEDILQHGV